MKRRQINIVHILLIVLVLIVIIAGFKIFKKEKNDAYKDTNKNGLTIETDNEIINKHLDKTGTNNNRKDRNRH